MAGRQGQAPSPPPEALDPGVQPFPGLWKEPAALPPSTHLCPGPCPAQGRPLCASRGPALGPRGPCSPTPAPGDCLARTYASLCFGAQAGGGIVPGATPPGVTGVSARPVSRQRPCFRPSCRGCRVLGQHTPWGRGGAGLCGARGLSDDAALRTRSACPAAACAGGSSPVPSHGARGACRAKLTLCLPPPPGNADPASDREPRDFRHVRQTGQPPCEPAGPPWVSARAPCVPQVS